MGLKVSKVKKFVHFKHLCYFYTSLYGYEYCSYCGKIFSLKRHKIYKDKPLLTLNLEESLIFKCHQSLKKNMSVRRLNENTVF